jgi:tetratricopeptide (TPR) repeat protein
VAIDDIHLCDYLSASHLLAGVFPVGVVLVACAPSLEAIGQEESQEISLGPFTEKDVKKLVTTRFTGDFNSENLSRKLLESTHGNPLHLFELIASVPPDEGTPATLLDMFEEKSPAGISEASLHRLQSLDTGSTTLLKYASVIADRFPLLILRQMLSDKFPMDKALRNLNRLRLASIEANADGRDLFCFEHTAVREAAFSLLGGVERERLHVVAASALKRYYGRNADEHLMSIANHYEQAGENESAADTYFRAGDYFVKAGDFPSAEEAYRAAEGLFEDEGKKLEVMAGYIAALGAQSKIEKCLEISERLFAGNPPPRLKARVLGNLARVHATTGSLHEAEKCAREAIELAEESGDREELSKACNYLAFALAMMGKPEQARDCGERARELAEELGDDRLIGGAFQSLAGAEFAAGNLQEAKRLYELAADKFRKIGHFFNVAVMKTNLGVTQRATGRFEEALQSYQEAVSLHERMGVSASLGIVKSNTAVVLIDLCRYRESLSLLENSEPLYRKLKSPALGGLATLVKARCLVKMGQVENVLPLLEEGWQARKHVGRVTDRLLVVDILADLAILTGETDKVLGESKELLEEAENTGEKEIFRESLILRLKVLLNAGLPDEAEGVGKLVEEGVTAGEDISSQAGGKALLARLAAGRGDFGKAEDLLKQAAAIDGLGKEASAQAALHIGEAFLRAGKKAKAREYLERAKEEYGVLVAAGYRTHELEKTSELLGSCQ